MEFDRNDIEAMARGLQTDLEAQRAEETRAIEMYESKDPGTRKQIRNSLVLEVRCKVEGHLLFAAWRTPSGTMFYQPSFTLSPGKNAETSNAAGRSKHTSDGDRQWRSRGGMVDRLEPFDEGVLNIHCDDLSGTIPFAAIVSAANATKPGRPERAFLE